MGSMATRRLASNESTLTEHVLRPASRLASSECSLHTPFASITKSLSVKASDHMRASASRST
jgi:hypothetical protein